MTPNIKLPEYVPIPKKLLEKIDLVNQMTDLSDKNKRRVKTVKSLLGKPDQKRWVNFRHLKQCLNSILESEG